MLQQQWQLVAVSGSGQMVTIACRSRENGGESCMVMTSVAMATTAAIKSREKIAHMYLLQVRVKIKEQGQCLFLLVIKGWC